MLTGIADTAVCVPDVDAAVERYVSVLGLRVLSPPYRMEGDAIERDMGELLPSPVVVKAAIVGLGDDDRVLELIEYPTCRRHRVTATRPSRQLARRTSGWCATTSRGRLADLEERGVTFLTRSVADVAGLRTTWFRDPWGVVFILLESAPPTAPTGGSSAADVEQLDGKVAVITGAASGIGRALAARLAAEGVALVLADVEGDALEVAGRELQHAGATVIVQPTDVSKAESVDALRERGAGPLRRGAHRRQQRRRQLERSGMDLRRGRVAVGAGRQPWA